MAQRELPSLLDVAGIVEAHGVAAVDEGDTACADDLADVAVDDQRRVLVDAEAEHLPIPGDDDEEPLQPPPLLKLRVDDRLVAGQTWPGTAVRPSQVAPSDAR